MLLQCIFLLICGCFLWTVNAEQNTLQPEPQSQLEPQSEIQLQSKQLQLPSNFVEFGVGGGTGGVPSYWAWHNTPYATHVSNQNDAFSKGYRYISLSIHGDVGNPYYTAVTVYNPSVTQHVYLKSSVSGFQSIFDSEAGIGYGPTIIVATGTSSSNAIYAAVFENAPNGIPLTRSGLKSGADSDLSTIQGMNKNAKSQGLIPRWLAVYGDSSDPRFIGIWVSNPSKTIWNADGLVENASQYQARFNAQTSGWARPALVTLNYQGLYLSLFVDNQIGSWVSKHDMTASDYQTQFNTQASAGYYPILVQGGGTGSSTKFAALWATGTQVPTPALPLYFTATGPIANTQIDAIIEKAMRQSPVRHASLAIIKGTQLVYVRGYTLGENGWPLAQPTTQFRQASVSKTITALAIYQLLESGKIKITDTLQSILQLRTPAGYAPTDSRFSQVTVKQLLEHTSGINPDAFSNDLNTLNAWQAVSSSYTLPVTETMIDAYIASLNLVTNPGTSQVYNNCGYYLLSRIVAKVRNRASPFDAINQYLLAPLGITRIRRAPSALSSMPSDEARYRTNDDIPVYKSVLNSAQVLVPNGYGNGGLLETKEGAGGFSGSATDMARLVSLLIQKTDSAVLKRSTITNYLTAASSVSAAGYGRAGYGFDYAQNYGNGNFYVQKGGSLATSHNVLEMNGDWGLIMNWAGSAAAATNWYPDYPDVMTIAKATSWTSDLFPTYGL